MSRYVHNYEAFDQQVLASGWMEADMRARAERIKEQFEATAPVGEPYEGDDHPGRFRDSARVTSGTAHFGQGIRAYGRVHVDDPAALSIEFGHHAKNGRFVEGSHTLTNALDAAG